MNKSKIEITEKSEREYERYLRAGHAMQSGVALMMNYDPANTTPKHLRVGVNMAMIDSAAIAQVLMEKGIFTWEELATAIANKAEEEVKQYEAEIEAHVGRKVTLG